MNCFLKMIRCMSFDLSTLQIGGDNCDMMPSQLVGQDNHATDVRVKTVYSGDVFITYINHHITLEEFTQEMMAICRFAPDQVLIFKIL